MFDANIVGTGLWVTSVFFGIVTAYLVISIYNKTKGGSPGWISLMLTYVSLGFWGVTQVVFTAYPNFGMRVVISIILFGVISVTNSMTPIYLIRDMKIDSPKWYSIRNYLVGVVAFFGIMIWHTFFFSGMFSNPFSAMLSITLLAVGVLFLVTALGFYKLYKATNLRFWLINTLAVLSVGFGVFLILGFTDCCAPGAILEEASDCSGWIYDYEDVLTSQCMPGMLPLVTNGSLFIILGEVLSFYAMFRINREMS